MAGTRTGRAGGLSPADVTTSIFLQNLYTSLANVILASIWFIGTKLFWNQTAPAYKVEIETFFTRMNTPVDFNREEGESNANDARQSSVVGWLCVAYGIFVALLALIPNSAVGRIAFVGCGGVVILVGTLLIRTAHKSPATPPVPGTT